MRAAWTLGVRPCSASATSARSRKNTWSAVGARPVASRKKYSVKLVAPISSVHRSRPRTVIRSAAAVEIEVVAAPRLPISMDVSLLFLRDLLAAAPRVNLAI